MSEELDGFEDPNQKWLKLGEDYFSYALFAFYLFDD